MKKHSKPFALLLCAALTLTPALAMTGCSTGSNSDMKGLAIDGTDFGITIEGTNVTEESVFTSNDIIYYEAGHGADYDLFKITITLLFGVIGGKRSIIHTSSKPSTK